MSIPQVTPPADSAELLWAQDEYICRLFAMSARFQTEVGAANETEAMDHIIDWADVGDDFTGARILVRMDGGLTRRQESMGCWKTTGSIPVYIEWREAEFPETNAEYRSSKARFRAFFSKVLSEVEAELNQRRQILGFNPIALIQYSLTAGPWLMPATETTRYDNSDEDTPTAVKNLVHWWVELSFEIY